MTSSALVRVVVVAACVFGAVACGAGPARVEAPPRAAVTALAPPRESADERELARYAAREQQSSGLESFEGGRGASTNTIVLVLVVVILVLLLV